jgi:hypothetical protein
MTRPQCAALMPDGRRCRHAAAPRGLFCAAHAVSAPEITVAPPEEAEGTPSYCSAALRQWLLGLLQAEMLALCAADLSPLDRAHALADLGGLFLEALPSFDDVDARVAELEVRASEMERQLDPG